jgi:phosphotransferase system HPr (HPr) family protein
VIVKECNGYPGQISVTAASGTSDLRSLMDLFRLGLEQGARVSIRVSGPDEERVCDRLVEIFETHFDFPPLTGKERVRSLATLIGGFFGEPRS